MPDLVAFLSRRTPFSLNLGETCYVYGFCSCKHMRLLRFVSLVGTMVEWVRGLRGVAGLGGA